MTDRYITSPVNDEDRRPPPCGWFDSTQDLLRGLSVIERLDDVGDDIRMLPFFCQESRP